MHRDIKPSNILIDSNNNPKIIDFGRAAKLSQAGEKLKGSEGTYHFMAPEMLHEHDKSGYDATLCDIWSLGVTFYCIAL
jgi:serine/threonine protein kinase